MLNTGFVEWTTPGSYTWTVPVGVPWVGVRASAGGGGGGSCLFFFSTDSGGGGGGSGESCEGFQLQVTPGGTLAITVGAVGPHGTRLSTWGNVHAGPEGNVGGGNDGGGGGDTIVGPIQLKGGYGGLAGGNAPHAGKGGGTNFGAQGENSGGAGAVGHVGVDKDSVKWWPGGGGGAATTNNTGTCTGAPCGPFLGGAEGSRTGGTGKAWGGGGGASSIFGRGGAGGDVGADAPAVTTIGVGGGGGGGSPTTQGGTSQGPLGADGGPGYVGLFYFITS